LQYLVAHFRVVAALLIREMSSRFGRNPGGYLWALLDPISHIAFMSIIFMAISRTPALGTSFPLFFATGYIAFQFYQSLAGYLASAISGNRALLSYPAVAPIDTVFSRYLLQLITTALVGICVLGALLVYAKHPASLHFPHLLSSVLKASWIALGIGMANIVLFARFPLYEKLFGVVMRPLFLVSGIFYLPEALPPVARDLVLLNPLSHIVMEFRMGFYPQYRALGYDAEYVAWFACICLMTGMSLFTFGRGVIRAR
jgi:capsular polysaccharide transport system permease protein